MLVGMLALERAKKIITDESVYPTISDDGCPEASEFDVTTFFGPFFLVLSPNEWTVFVLVPVNSFTYEVHTNILPEGRGKLAIEACDEALFWVFSETNILKLITHVPISNVPAYALARKAGFKREGVNEKSWLKNGVLHDQLVLGLSKGDWLCRLQR